MEAPETPCSGLTRKVLASVGTLTAAGCLTYFVIDEFDGGHDNEVLAILIPALLLVATSGLIYRRALGAQLLARGALWSTLLMGLLFATAASGDGRDLGGYLVLSSGIPILLLGQLGLESSQASANNMAFAPVAFRGTLMMAMIMAIADTQTLLLWGSVAAIDSAKLPIGMFSCAAAMMVALYGLYKTRLWGLLLNIVANIVIAALALSGMLAISEAEEIVALLMTTAILQLLVPIPLVLAIARGKAPKSAKWTAGLAPLLVTGLIVLGTYAGFIHGGRLLQL